MTVCCGPVVWLNPSVLECACGWCRATLTSPLSVEKEQYIVDTFNRLHRERADAVPVLRDECP